MVVLDANLSPAAIHYLLSICSKANAKGTFALKLNGKQSAQCGLNQLQWQNQ